MAEGKRRNKIHILLGAAVLLLLASIYIVKNFYGSVDMTNPEEVDSAVAEAIGTDVFEVVKTADSGPYRCVLVRTPDEMRLVIFEAAWFGGRHRYFGGGTQNGRCGTYQYTEPELTLVVVYGENEGGAACCALQVNGEQHDRAISGDSVLEIYALEEPMAGIATGALLDADGNTVCVLDASEPK